ncbi:hypothetical protein SAY86_009294 [Trapa natans]|uniref:Uncharacterized protein n=1 Tax=Trapa natans TaxID=22666 RepID=A0AAN7KZH4_TRANT|nr:hypothetical protein SAY86_009294 [Trapa natans]
MPLPWELRQLRRGRSERRDYRVRSRVRAGGEDPTEELRRRQLVRGRQGRLDRAVSGGTPELRQSLLQRRPASAQDLIRDKHRIVLRFCSCSKLEQLAATRERVLKESTLGGPRHIFNS